MAFMIIGYLLTSAPYHFALFLMNHRRRTKPVFAGCCFLLLMSTNKIIPRLFPDYNGFGVICPNGKPPP